MAPPIPPPAPEIRERLFDEILALALCANPDDPGTLAFVEDWRERLVDLLDGAEEEHGPDAVAWVLIDLVNVLDPERKALGPAFSEVSSPLFDFAAEQALARVPGLKKDVHREKGRVEGSARDTVGASRNLTPVGKKAPGGQSPFDLLLRR